MKTLSLTAAITTIMKRFSYANELLVIKIGIINLMVNSSEAPQSPTRRNFLKYIPSVIVGAGVTALVGGEFSHEVELQKSGWFKTKDALWYPIYERHDEHHQTFVPTNIPSTLDVISMEGILSILLIGEGVDNITMRSVYTLDQDYLASATLTGSDTTPQSNYRLVPDETQQYLEKFGILLAYGDTLVHNNRSFGDNFQSETQNYKSDLLKLLSMALGGSNLIQTFEIAQNKRRSFLMFTAISSVLLGLAVFSSRDIKNQVHAQLMESIEKDEVSKRVWARINTLLTDGSPEEISNLFRELVQANKLMTLAQYLKTKSGSDLPKVGYSWHLGHRGIEDWLRLGQDITRACLLAFPDKVLKQILEFNDNDPRSLTSIRIFNITSKPNDLGIDSIIEDTTLTEMLKQKHII